MRVTLQNAEGNVAVLCPLGSVSRNYHHSGESVDEVHEIVAQMGIPASKYHSQEAVPRKLERYLVTTYKSAKGMEFDAVVIPRINFFKQIPEEWYVACTRARSHLFVYRDLGDPRCDPLDGFGSETYDSVSLEAQSATDRDEAPF